MFCFPIIISLVANTLTFFFFNFNLKKIIHVFPSWTLLPPPSPYHPSGSSQCTSPKHPASCIEPVLASRFIHDISHVSMPFSQIFPPSPSITLHLQCRRCRFNHWLGKIPWRRVWLPTPVFLPGKCHGKGSLVGYSPWGHKELDRIEWLNHHNPITFNY